jgi:ATP-dependent Lon protease
MAHSYNLRKRVKTAKPPPQQEPPDQFDPMSYQLMLTELFPSNYVNRKVANLMREKVIVESEDEEDSDYTTTDSDYETEGEGSDEDVCVKVVVNLGEESSDEEDVDSPVGKFMTLVNRKPANERAYFGALKTEEQDDLVSKLAEIEKYAVSTVPPRITLIASSMPPEYKAIALRKLAAMKGAHDGELHKLKSWIDGFMKIPFGQYCQLPVTMTDGADVCHAFMAQAKKTLDESCYGLNDAKMQIMQYIGQLISNPKATGTAIAIRGPMGTGKTTLVKEGISKILQRPFAFIALGGATDSGFLEGHLITYEGSVWGQIATTLMQCKTMNPVFYFDELDKVSDTPKGEEIIGILTHLTDSSQNDMFHDKYFAEVALDLSRAIFIFSYNDETKINPILRDRMYTITTDGYTSAQKATIAKQFLSKSIRSNVNMVEDEVRLTDEAVSYIIEHYTAQEKGVRNLKRCIETIYSKLNLFRLMKPGTNLFETDMAMVVEFPFVVTPEIVRKLLKSPVESNHMHMYS